MSVKDRPVGAFTDDAGREWKMKITYADLAELREIGVDLNKMRAQTVNDQAVFLFGVQGENDALQGEAAVVNMCEVLCQDLIKERGLNQRQFAKLFDGRVMGEATQAILEAVADFSHRSNLDMVTPQVRAIRSAFNRANQIVGKEMSEHLDNMETMTDEQLKTYASTSQVAAA